MKFQPLKEIIKRKCYGFVALFHKFNFAGEGDALRLKKGRVEMPSRFLGMMLGVMAIASVLATSCGAPPDPKTQILGKWKDNSNGIMRGAVTEFLPDGHCSTTITLNGKPMSDTGTYSFMEKNRIQVMSNEVIGGAREVRSFEVQFDGDTMTATVGRGSGNEKSMTYERVK